MVNSNDVIKHYYWPFIFDLCFMNPDVMNVCMRKTKRFLDEHMTYIFLNERILQPSLKMCVFI